MRQPGRTQSRLAYRSRPQHQRVRVLHRTTLHIWLLGTALLSMVACTEPELVNPNFPQLREKPNSYMEALLEGELVSENGCLRVKNIEHGSDHLVVWPYDSEMTADGQGVRVRISDGSEATLSVGEEVRIGGGELLSLSFVQRIVKQPIPSNCLGDSYWVAGEISTSSE